MTDQGFLDLVRRTEVDTIGRSYRDITDPEDLGRSADMLVTLRTGAAPVRLQKRYLRPDGSTVAANLLVTRFSNPDRLVSTLFWKESGRQLPPARLWEAALGIRHVHRAREDLFGTELSTDPVGSMLMCLYLAEAEGRNVRLDEIASDTGLHASTASRWLKVLQQRGVVRSDIDATTSVELTTDGLERLEKMLATVYEAPNASLIFDASS